MTVARVSKSPQQEASGGSPRGDVAKSPFNARTRPRRPSLSGSRRRSHADLHDRLPPRKNSSDSTGFLHGTRSRTFGEFSVDDDRRIVWICFRQVPRDSPLERRGLSHVSSRKVRRGNSAARFPHRSPIARFRRRGSADDLPRPRGDVNHRRACPKLDLHARVNDRSLAIDAKKKQTASSSSCVPDRTPSPTARRRTRSAKRDRIVTQLKVCRMCAGKN